MDMDMGEGGINKPRVDPSMCWNINGMGWDGMR